MTNDRFRIHLTSGNSAHRNQQESGAPKERRQLLKYAIFYLVVAAIPLGYGMRKKDGPEFALPATEHEGEYNVQNIRVAHQYSA